MTTDMTPTVAPPRRRALHSSAALLVLGATFVAGPASAEPPTTWEDAQREAPLSDLIFLIGVPLLVIALTVLLVYLPVMVRRQQGESAAFRTEPEWFGGPRAGVDATTDATVSEEPRGGASARW